MPDNVISEINPTGAVGGEYKLKDSVARGLFFESEDDYEEAVSQGLLNDLPDGTMIYTPSTGGGGGGGGSTTVVEELSDIEAMTVFNGEAAGAKAVKTLKQAFSDALTALKNTAIAQAVGATASDTFTSLITKLGAIVNRGGVSPSKLNVGDSYTIPEGYHDGTGVVEAETAANQSLMTIPTANKSITISSTGTTSNINVKNYATASVTTSDLVKPSGTKSITANGSDIDVSSYKYVTVNVSKSVRLVISCVGHLAGVAGTTATVKWWGTAGVKVYINGTLTASYTVTSGTSQADGRSVANSDTPTSAGSSDKTY